MEKKHTLTSRFPPALVIPILIGLAAAWVRFAPPSFRIVTARVGTNLPAEAGPWTGSRILYCQDDKCGNHSLAQDDTGPDLCPVCQGPMLPASPSERTILPADTVIARRIYRASQGPTYTLTVVQSGADHRSIHRPQECLPGQGARIDRQRTEALALGPRILRVMILDARFGTGNRDRFGFAYWFAGPDRDTPSYFARHLWPTLDRLFRNTASRWAYVTVLSSEPFDTPESLQRLSAFLAAALPKLETPTPK